jgi:hypothetical protein
MNEIMIEGLLIALCIGGIVICAVIIVLVAVLMDWINGDDDEDEDRMYPPGC